MVRFVAAREKSAGRDGCRFEETVRNMAKNGAAGKVQLHKPPDGETIQVAIRPGCVYLLDFEPGESLWEKKENDALLSFDGVSGVVVLRGFFSEIAETEDFFLELRDGTMLSGRDLVLGMTQDFQTNGAGLVSGAGQGELLSVLFDEREPLFFALAGHDGAGHKPGTVVHTALHGGAAGFSRDGSAGYDGEGINQIVAAGKLPPLGDMLDCSLPSLFGGDAALGELDLLLPPRSVGGEGAALSARVSVFSSFVDFSDDCPDEQLLARLFLLSL
ncbi:MAG: hypothetical protein LBD42_02745 [Desulfovibrio sp.]|jgi:hypothetical protein|nr:hypothetical protein [Desulfovibrio sp.]